MNRSEIGRIVKEQLACELNCSADDFSRNENIITSRTVSEKRRVLSEKPEILQMATFGNNAVISADERLHPWLREWAANKTGFWLFEQQNYYELECELRKYGYRMALTHHMFLPDMEKEDEDFRTDLKYRWLDPSELSVYYGRKAFSNALCDRFHPERPDVLAVVAMSRDKIMGMAGCSADTPVLWQIGIDVLPQFRGCGVGTALVTLLKKEAIRRGAIPYYGTSLSNLASWKIALASGFAPAWIETVAEEL